MADPNLNQRKAKKGALPPGWIEKISKKHPDRPFFFNEETGETRWSPPLENDDKEKSEHKSKKRKAADTEGELSDASPDAASKILAGILNRPKLKAKSVKIPISPAKEAPNNDTPVMRLYRQRLAERKAIAELKKSKIKSVNQKQKQTNKSPKLKNNLQDKSIASSSDTNSECSVASSTSSMGSKIKSSATSAVKTYQNNNNLQKKPLNTPPKVTKDPVDKPATPDQTKTNDSLDNDVSICTRSSTTSRTPANERMKRLRKSLDETKEDGEPAIDDFLFNSKSKLMFSSPVLHGAEQRLFSLETRVQNDGMMIVKNIAKTRNVDNDESKRILKKVEVPNVYCEDMEWEPIEDEKIMSEIYSARVQLCTKPAEALSELSNNALKSASTFEEKNALYIIIDTNVFLSNLMFVEEVRDSRSDIFGRPFIVVPWTVIQELDFIKDDKNNTRSQALRMKARKAVDFLNQHFTAKHPRFIGQTPAEVEANKEKFMIDCPDDEILQTCLQFKESLKSPVLLSYDKNLCNKAMIHDIPVLGRNDPLEKIYYLKAAETTQFLSNSIHWQNEPKLDDDSIVQRELLLADDIMEEGKAVLKSVLSQVVAKEMEVLFGDGWERHVIIRPPWTVITVLKCALKHWLAAVSESFSRGGEKILRVIQVCLTETPDSGRKLKDAKFFLDKCDDLFQTLDVKKYPVFKVKILTQIDELKKRCETAINEINNAQFQQTVGSIENESEQEQRAKLAFTVFEEIYAFARDTCGIAADTLGLQCAIVYNKFHPLLTSKLAIQEQQNVGVNVNRLLQILRLCLSNDHRNNRPNDRAILSLYEIILNFSSILQFDELLKLTPIDLYCCLRLNRAKLEKGYQQLQELAIHFCRMANFKCT